MGDLNQDEGWYLYAALRVAEGWLPYRDFAFTQGPALPLVYSLFSPVVETFGVAGGRAVTLLFGLLTAGFAARIASRLGGNAAGLLTFTLLTVNVYHSYFSTVVKTYSLCALFAIVGFYALARSLDKRCHGWMFLAGVALAAAAGTRISMGILLPVVGLWLLFQPARWGRLSWLWFGFGGGVTLLVIFLPLYLAAPEGFRFGLIEFHTLRDGGGLLGSMVFKGGFISRLVQAYFIPVILLAAIITVKIWRPFKGTDTGYHQTDSFNLIRLLWVAVVAVTLVHITAPFPYDDYQVPVFPLLAVALSVSWAFAIRSYSASGYRWEKDVVPSDPAVMRWFVGTVVVVSLAASFSSPINQDWMIGGRDRIWWKIKSKPSLLLLRDVASELKQDSASGELLTQDTYLAVEAGLKVPRGWEMGPFSYFPDFSDEKAAALHLVNKNGLLNTISQSPAEWAAISGYGLSIASPEVKLVGAAEYAEIMTALELRFEPVREVPMFGQASTTLRIFRAKGEP